MNNNVLFSSKNDEWATPTQIIQLAHQVLGHIELDPATSAAAQQRVNAQRCYTANGLVRPWKAETLWLNPPYVRGEIGKWVNKWVQCEFNAGLLLVPARTDAKWFQPLWGLPMCFITGRLKFGNSANSAPFPSVIVYHGSDWVPFYNVFQPIGNCGVLLR